MKCIIKILPFAKSHVSASVRSGLAAQHGSCRLLSLPAAGDCMRAPGNAYPKKPTRHSTELSSGSRRHWHHAPKQRRQERLERKWKAVRLGCLAAHGEQMDEKRSRDKHWRKKRSNLLQRRDILSRKDQKIGSAISLPSYLYIRIYNIAYKYLYKENAVTP